MKSEDTIVTKIQVEKEISAFTLKEKIWSVLINFESYSKQMDNVTSVKTFQKNGVSFSEWNVEIEGAPLNWIERDEFNHEKCKIKFEAVSGDLYIFKGSWQLHGNAAPFKIIFQVEYSLGIPNLERALGHILKQKMNDNIMQMLESINKELLNE